MKQTSLPTPFALNLGRAALIALPVLVARADAAPKSPVSTIRTSVRSTSHVDVKAPAASGEATRGAVFNRAPGQSVELALPGKSTARVTEGTGVVRTIVRDGVLSVEAVKAGQAVIVVEREGLAPQNYVVRVRDTAATRAAAVRPVSAPALHVITEAVAQTADLTVPTKPAEAAPATDTSAATASAPVTVTPATTGAPTDVTVSTGSAPATRTITTPRPVASGNLATGSGRQFDNVRVSPSLPAPSRLPRGTAAYPTTPNIPATVKAATKTAPRNSIQVTQGLARLLQFRKNILSVFFSDVAVMDARAVNARTVALTGLAPGTSTLAVFSERFPGDAIGQPVIYQVTVRAPVGPTVEPAPAPSVESVEAAIRTAIDDPRIGVSVIQAPNGSLTARLTGAVHDPAEATGLKETAQLFVPNVVSAVYVDKAVPGISDVPRVPANQELQDSLRRITDNESIEVLEAPNGTSILKASVNSANEADAILRLVPTRTRITPFIVIRGAGGSSSVYDSPRPTLSAEDAELTDKMQAVTGIRTAYISRTALNTMAVFGTVKNRTEFDRLRRYTVLLPQKRNDITSVSQPLGGNGIEQGTELERPKNFATAGDTFNRGIQMFVRILDPNDAVLRKVTVQSNVVEINRTALRNLGVEYGSATLLNETRSPTTGITRTVDPTFQPGTTLAGNSFGGFGGFSTIDPFRTRLNALYTRGNARILSSPNVSALDGATAQIVVGGSRPIPTAVAATGGVGTGVEFRRYGIIMTMRPTLTDDDTILLQIRADVTNIDPTTAVTLGGAQIPGETVRSVDTTLNVREGDIIVMGGLITNEQQKRTSKVPVLSNLPILGSLFTSKRFENNETELAIFMTPTITRTPISPEGNEMALNIVDAEPLPGNTDGGSTVNLIRGTGQ